jgi:hypothetical protein
VSGLHIFIPFLALSLAAIVWIAGFSLWAALAAFLLAGPCAVVAALLVQTAETWRARRPPRPRVDPPPPGDAPQPGAPCSRSAPPDGGHL